MTIDVMKANICKVNMFACEKRHSDLVTFLVYGKSFGTIMVLIFIL